MTSDSVVETYLAAVAVAQDQVERVRRGPPLPTEGGSWTFLFVAAAPGQKLHPAAVGPTGQVVQPGKPEGWADLLTATSDLAALQERIGWLHGSWMSIRPGEPSASSILRRHPDAEELLGPPIVSPEGNAVVFRAWYAEPPAREPFRVTLRVATDQISVERHRADQLR